MMWLRERRRIKHQVGGQGNLSVRVYFGGR
jgi:hypothetical protein